VTTQHETPERQGGGFGPGCATVLVLLVIALVLKSFMPVIQPHVSMASEPLLEHPLFTIPGLGPLGEVYLTNAMVAWLISAVVVLLAGFYVGRKVRRAMAEDNYVLTGFADVFVSVVEYLYNLTESTAGRWTKVIFPYFATIMALVLVANWMELVPGVDSIGILKPAHGHHGYLIKQVGPVYSIWEEVKGEDAAAQGEVYEFIPFVRVASTDLNFTLSLALVSVLSTQVIGLWAQRWYYLEKFFNFRALVNKPGMGVLDFAVGFLELISEFSKILSFTFRLFGNLFAGTVLLFVMGALLPVALFVFYFLELFVGLVQAFVFGVLTMVFMAQATQAHH